MSSTNPTQVEAACLERQTIDKPGSRHIEGNSLTSELEEKVVSLSPQTEANLTYEYGDEEPEIHARTWIAVAAMCLLNFVQIIALQGPPVVVSLGFGAFRLFRSRDFRLIESSWTT